MLPLRAMSRSVSRSLTYITTKDSVAILGLSYHLGPHRCQELCRADPVPRWRWHSGELSLPLPSCSIWESGPAPRLGNTVELVLMVKALVSQPQGCENRRAVLVPPQLQHLGDWVLHLDWTAQ